MKVREIVRVLGSFDLQIIPARFEMKQTPAEINLRRQEPEMELDFTSCRAAIGYEESLPFQLSFSQQALETVQKGIERRVREGEIIKASEKHTKFADIAREREIKEIGVASLVYLPPVRVRVKPGDLKYSIQVGGVTVAYTPGAIHVLASKFDITV
ncbi:MAG: DUF6470 family protein [Desulfitobacteriaceae bacterium]